MKKLLAIVLAVALVSAVALIALPVALISGFASMATIPTVGLGYCLAEDNPAMEVLGELPTDVVGLNNEQVENAAIIMHTASDLGLPERAQVIGLMTAMQESGLRNLPAGDRDSVGMFQQRPSQGWGSPSDLVDPTYSSLAFYRGVTAPNGSKIPGLVDVTDWQTMSLTEAAQAVQRSAYPDAYAKHEAKARKIMAALAGVSVKDASNGLVDNSLACDPNGGTVVAASTEGIPTQAQLKSNSSQVPCPEGTVDLGVTIGGVDGKKVPIRLCSIPGTVCTGMDCRAGELQGRARGEVIVNSLVAPHFSAWVNAVRGDGHLPTFNSSFRSWESQSYLWRGGANDNAAEPGWSNHQMGSAIDISGLPGSYNRDNCVGYTPDGSCKADGTTWGDYWAHGVAHGAVFHDEEFWHLEWIVTRAEQRTIPFIP